MGTIDGLVEGPEQLMYCIQCGTPVGLGVRLCEAHASGRAPAAETDTGTPPSVPLAPPLAAPLAGPLRSVQGTPSGQSKAVATAPAPRSAAGVPRTPPAAPAATPRRVAAERREARTGVRAAVAGELIGTLGTIWLATAALTAVLGIVHGDFQRVDLLVAPLRMLAVWPLLALLPATLLTGAVVRDWRAGRAVPGAALFAVLAWGVYAVYMSAAWAGAAAGHGSVRPAALAVAPVLYLIAAVAVVRLRSLDPA